jgi:predicted transcriptional regulator
MEDLRALRTLAGISQFTCARRARVPRVRISLFESGQLELRLEEQARIRTVLLKAIEARALQLQMVLADSRAKVAGISA